MALPRRDDFRIPGGPWASDLPQEFPSATLAGYRAQGRQVFAAHVFRLDHRRNAGYRDPPISGRSVWRDRRRPYVELLPPNGTVWRHRNGSSDLRIDFRSELLVPVFLPVWRADGPRFACEPAAHSPQLRSLH